MAENKINVGGRLHSIATGNVLAGANEIFDDEKNKKQNDINTETYSLVNNINERLNGLSPDQQSALNVATKATNNEAKLGYYVCDTEGNAAAKVIFDATGYVLSLGGSIKVKMTNVNTADNATLNINSTGAKPLYYDGERASANNTWKAGETVEVYYDGTSYYANNVAGGSGSGDGDFDISAKTGQSYINLSAALTAADSILSTSKKKGGMSIKYIQSSDNKYAQYRLMADTWSIDTDDWSFCGNDVLVDNPEWIYVLLDAEKRILAGLKSDGSVEWSIGIPTPIKEYITEHLTEIMADVETKVDKEDGKSLVDSEFAGGISYVENPEFVDVKTDAEGKILLAIKADGSIYYGAGCPQQVKDYIEEKLKGFSLDEYKDIVSFLSDYLGNDSTLNNIIGEWNNAVSGKKISILGDSISTFNQDGYKIDGYAMYYPTAASDRGVDVTTVNDTWWMQVINSVAGTLEVNASSSGSTASSGNIGFSPRVPLLGNPDVIYVALGTNDSSNGVIIGEINFEAETYDLTQFAPAYIKGMQDTIAAYPKAKIVCVAFDMGADYQNAIKTIAEHYGAEYIYVGDISVVHPNKAEMTAVANRITQSAKYTITDAINILSNGKVDKETRKSLIDTGYASSCSTIENPEYLQITTDSDDRILEGTQVDGTKVIGGDIRVLGNMEVSGVSYKVIENPEYLAAWVDAENKIIFGLKTDGKTYIGDADFLNNIKGNQDAITKIKTTLATIGTEIDSLDIDALSSTTATENPEFTEVTTDSEDKILEGIREDGTKILSGDLNVGGSAKILGNMEISGVSYKVVENHEFLAIWVDAEDKVIFGIKTDGKTYVGDADFLNDIDDIKNFLQNITDKNIDWDALSYITTVENSEYIEVKTDSEGKLLAGRTPDGVAFENVGFSTPKVFIDGHSIKNNEDPEGKIEMLLDMEDKIISYRDSDGVKHEECGIETKEVSTDSLKLSERGMTEFHQALINSGFTPGGKSDWSRWFESHKEALELPIPAKAIANITGINDMPTKKLVDYHAEFEYWDRIGNYFKTKVILNAQGSSTMADPMKSISVDFCADDWIGDKTFDLKFGNWVVQDGFHLKAFYKDALKSIQPVSYIIGENITKHLGVRSNRFHIGKDSTTLYGGTGNIDDDFSEALCHPDQFPVEVYLNGEYYGLFVWSLKKNRKNYSMNKKDYESILVDNVYGMYFSKQNKFDWLAGEIRNPKTLICVDGQKYDADTHMGELIGTDTIAGQTYTFCKLNAATTGTETFEVTSVAYDSSNKDMKNTAKTKSIIEDCVGYLRAVKDAQTTEEKRSLLQQYFDVDNIIAYIIFSELTFNRDGLTNNAQISIFDRKVGYNIYDCDSCLGKWASGLLLSTSLSHEVISPDSQSVLGFIKSCYSSEIASAYKKLRDDKIIDKDTIADIVDGWFDRIGHDAIKRSIEKWPTSPSYRKCTNLNVSYWKPVIPLNVNGIERYSESKQYQIGDVIYVAPGNITQSDNYQKNYYECVESCVGEYPTTNGNYTVDGIYDTPMRIKMWIEKRIVFCDNLWNYSV